MRHPVRVLLIALFGLTLLPPTARAGDDPGVEIRPTENPFLWRIAGRAKPSWVYGTIHLPDERIVTLPDVVERSVDGCDEFYAEIPADPASQVALTPRLILPDGETLKDLLPEDLYGRVDRLFQSRGLPVAAVAKLKIWAIAVQIPLLDHLRNMASVQPLDALLYARAQEAGKTVGGLETPDEQLDVFDTLTREEQIRLLDATVEQFETMAEEGRDLTEEMIEVYLAGDGKKLVALMNESFDSTDPLEEKLMTRLLDDRDEVMAERIAKKLRAAPDRSFFFAVGAAHVVSREGVVARLKKDGFKLKRTTR